MSLIKLFMHYQVSSAQTDKSLEIATYSLFYKHLIWSVYSVFQKALFSALHGLTFQQFHLNFKQRLRGQPCFQ